MARRHEQAVALRAAETDIGRALRQRDEADRLALVIEDLDAVLLRIAHAPAAPEIPIDVDGNLWCGWGMGGPALDGVKVFDPQGKPIGFIALPERAANVCFGGPKRNRLFMAASHSIYSLYVNTQGAAGG